MAKLITDALKELFTAQGVTATGDTVGDTAFALLCGIQTDIEQANTVPSFSDALCRAFGTVSRQGGFLCKANSFFDTVLYHTHCDFTASEGISAHLGSQFMDIDNHAEVCHATFQNACQTAFPHAIYATDNGI